MVGFLPCQAMHLAMPASWPVSQCDVRGACLSLGLTLVNVISRTFLSPLFNSVCPVIQHVVLEGGAYPTVVQQKLVN